MKIYISDIGKKLVFDPASIDISGLNYQASQYIEKMHSVDAFGTAFHQFGCDRILTSIKLQSSLQMVRSFIDVMIRCELIAQLDSYNSTEFGNILRRANQVGPKFSNQWLQYVHSSFDVLLMADVPFSLEKRSLDELMAYFSLGFDNDLFVSEGFIHSFCDKQNLSFS